MAHQVVKAWLAEEERVAAIFKRSNLCLQSRRLRMQVRSQIYSKTRRFADEARADHTLSRLRRGHQKASQAMVVARM